MHNVAERTAYVRSPITFRERRKQELKPVVLG